MLLQPERPRAEEEEEEEEEEDDEEDDDEEDEEEESEEEDGIARLAGGSSAQRKDDADEWEYDAQPTNVGLATGGGGAVAGSIKALSNDQHDLEAIVDDGEHIPTPTKDDGPVRAMASASQSLGMSISHKDMPFDEEIEADGEEVPSDEEVPQQHVTPARQMVPQPSNARGPAAKGISKQLKNSMADEEIELDGGGDDEDEIDSDEESPAAHQNLPARRIDSPPKNTMTHEPSMYEEEEPKPRHPPNHIPHNVHVAALQVKKKVPRDHDDDDEDTSSEDEDSSPKGAQIPLYDANNFADLNVSPQVRELFNFITSFVPVATELETKLKPLIPDYMPSVGEIDTFVKIPRPDNKPDNLGLTVLDEPSAHQSNPSVVKMELRYSGTEKARSRPENFVDSVPYGKGRFQLIDKWVQDVTSLHRKNPSTQVHYSKPMPDLEALMQVWPPEFEDLISRGGVGLPPADIDMPLLNYARLVCVMVDIPVYENLIESLNVLFSLYSEFRTNQHFSSHPDL